MQCVFDYHLRALQAEYSPRVIMMEYNANFELDEARSILPPDKGQLEESSRDGKKSPSRQSPGLLQIFLMSKGLLTLRLRRVLASLGRVDLPRLLPPCPQAAPREVQLLGGLVQQGRLVHNCFWRIVGSH